MPTPTKARTVQPARKGRSRCTARSIVHAAAAGSSHTSTVHAARRGRCDGVRMPSSPRSPVSKIETTVRAAAGHRRVSRSSNRRLASGARTIATSTETPTTSMTSSTPAAHSMTRGSGITSTSIARMDTIARLSSTRSTTRVAVTSQKLWVPVMRPDSRSFLAST